MQICLPSSHPGAEAAIRSVPARSTAGEDIALYADEALSEPLGVVHGLRQQADKPDGQANFALADFVAPGDAGVADYLGGAKPADKVARLEALKAEGRKTLMVGDGFNDAPALAAAHASLSPVSAADVAQASADAVFLGEKLAPVARALELSRLARKLMRQNLGIAVIYNAIAVPLAISGLVTPLIAALAMSGSSLVVTGNALRAGVGAGESRTPEQAQAGEPEGSRSNAGAAA